VFWRRASASHPPQRWLAPRALAAAGVSHGYIALLELGRLPSPGKFRLDAIARALNLRTSDALAAGRPDEAEQERLRADLAGRAPEDQQRYNFPPAIDGIRRATASWTPDILCTGHGPVLRGGVASFLE
jgi:hypothetical protein